MPAVLEELRIRDFAVARSVVIRPGSGLNVFTGETGAGKSLVVGALAFVFGARRGREVIATGAERAIVEAALALPEGPVQLERAIGLSGRSSARRDGEPATLDQLLALGERLADIHGQSGQLALLRPAVQLAALDRYAARERERETVAAIVRELREVRRTAADLARDVRERERLIAQLEHESAEIAAAALIPGEDSALRTEHSRLANVARLIEETARAVDALDESPLGEAVAAIGALAARDPAAESLGERAALLEATAADLGRELRRYRDGLEEDPERLLAVNERLDLVARLRRRYGETIEEIVAYGEEAAARLATLTGADVSLEALREREAVLLDRLATAAAALSLARREAAAGLVAAVSAELERLGMRGAQLALGFACDDDPAGPLSAQPDYELITGETPPESEAAERHPRAFSESGLDRVEFLASFNPGEAPRPLAAVASGGETSRFLLALTTVLGSAAEPRIVVLDEVDEGVGGRAGALVGEALRRLAARHQVICVTHLPQVAAYAGRHFVVRKQSDGARTWSDVVEVEGAERLVEIASMLGGSSDAALAAAGELLASASAVTA